MTVPIRPFTPDDYEPLVAIENTVWPEYPGTAEEWRLGDLNRDPKCLWARWVLEDGGTPIGYCGYSQSSHNYHPHKFYVSVTVHPDRQGQRHGSRMYEHVVAAIEPHRPVALRMETREDYARSLGFLERRGFREEQRERESRLYLKDFDFDRFTEAEERVVGQGLEIRTLTEIQSDPDWEHKLHRLITEVQRDVPEPDPATEIPFDLWRQRFHSSINRLPDAYLVAVDGDQYVGLSYVDRCQAAAYLDTGLTGVLRSHRRRGIALALKLRVVRYGVDHGYPEIRTWNERNNAGMIGINDQLGFQPVPAWLFMVKVIRADGAE